jgi:hypothetical protein
MAYGVLVHQAKVGEDIPDCNGSVSACLPFVVQLRCDSSYLHQSTIHILSVACDYGLM